MRLLDLITNADGRLSTTTTAQFFGFVILAGILVWSALVQNDHLGEMYDCFAIYCGGLTVSKGAVSAIRSRTAKTTGDIYD